jgi:hypothetical protein
VVFFAPLLAKIHPHPQVYIINVDRFFDDRVTPPTAQILREREIRERYNEKRVWQSVHKAVCRPLPFVCGAAIAVYRDRDTGVWRRTGIAPFEAKPVSDGGPSDVERWDSYARLGEKFVAELPVDRSCVLLTIVPTVKTRRAEAQAIAARLGLDLVVPQVDGLRTFDGSHLDDASAERWSAAFLRDAGPRIRQCVRAAQPSS